MPALNKQSTKIVSEINAVAFNVHEPIWKDLDSNSFRDTDGSDSKAPRDYYDCVGIHFLVLYMLGESARVSVLMAFGI